MVTGNLKIDLLGTSFTIEAEESSEYLEKLLSHYKKLITQVGSSSHEKDALKTAILAGIMMCDELHKERLAFKKEDIPTGEMAEVEKLTLQMISIIDEVLA